MDVVVVGHVASPLTVGVLRGLRATGNRVRFLAQGPCDEDAASLGVADVRLPRWESAESVRECLLSTDEAFEATALCLITTHLEAAPRADFDLVDAAKGTSITHVVKFSACGAEISTAKMSQWHREVEKYVADAGCFTFCFLRPNFFFQHLKVFNPRLVQERRFAFPFCEEAAISFVDVRDVIRVALEVITDPETYTAETYSLTGPQALTMADVAAAFTEAFPSEAGPVVYEKLTFEETIERWKTLDVHAGWINNFRELFVLADSGKCAGISDDIEVVLERSPVDLGQCLTEHGAFFAAPPPDAEEDDEDWDSDEEEEHERQDDDSDGEHPPEPPGLEEPESHTREPVPEELIPARSLAEASEDSVEEVASAAVRSAVQDAIHKAVSEEVEDIVDDSVGDAVEDAVEHAIEDAVEDAVEKALGDKEDEHIRHAIQDKLEEIVEDAISDAVEDALEDVVKEGIQDVVIDAVEEAVETRVVEGVDQSVQEAVVEAVAGQATKEKIRDIIQDEIEDGVEDAIDGAVEHAVEKAIEHAVEEVVEPAIEQKIERVVEAGIRDAEEHEHAEDMAPAPPAAETDEEPKDIGECSSEESEDEGADYVNLISDGPSSGEAQAEEQESETPTPREDAAAVMVPEQREEEEEEEEEDKEVREVKEDQHGEEDEKEREGEGEEHNKEEHSVEKEHVDEEKHSEENEQEQKERAKEEERAKEQPPAKTMSKAQALRAKFEQQQEEPKKPLERVKQGGRDRPISQKLEFAAVANLLTSRPPMPGLGPRARDDDWNPEDGYEEEEKQDLFVPGFGCYFQPQNPGEAAEEGKAQNGETSEAGEASAEERSMPSAVAPAETTKDTAVEAAVSVRQPEAHPAVQPAPTPPPKVKGTVVAVTADSAEKEQDHHHNHSDDESPVETKKEAPEPATPAKKRAGGKVDVAEEDEKLDREPPTTRPKWVPDHESDRCQLCKKAFTMLHRRHHCRNCGRLFDADCCDSFIPLPNLRHKNPARVCTPCKRLYNTVYRKAMVKYRKR